MQFQLDVRHLALRGLVGSSVLCLDSSLCMSVPCRALCEMASHLDNVELDMVTRPSAEKKKPRGNTGGYFEEAPQDEDIGAKRTDDTSRHVNERQTEARHFPNTRFPERTA